MTTDPDLRKAHYRDEAREIVRKDRELRRAGVSVDTAGAIARAMERAYKQGLADAASDDFTSSPRRKEASGGERERDLQWIEIPKRASDLLRSIMSLSFDQHAGGRRRHTVIDFDDREVVVLRFCSMPTFRGYQPVKDGYKMIKLYKDGSNLDFTEKSPLISPQTVNILLRLELVSALAGSNGEVLAPTKKAMLAYQDLHRSWKEKHGLTFEVRGTPVDIAETMQIRPKAADKDDHSSDQESTGPRRGR